MRRLARLLVLFASGVGLGAAVAWLRGPDAPVFREPSWPPDRPWPPIKPGDSTA